MSAPVPDLKSIFAGALELAPGPARAASLDEACGEDAALRERLEALLAADSDAGGFLAPEELEPGLAPGAEVGPYRLLEPIGEGGFGVVWVAEQTAPVRRRVALKVIKAGMDTREVVARFQAERQALALMDHPHIARVYDAGATPAGRPYFVMELVHGVAIHDYCDRSRLPLRDRLELFVQVCRAVQHAHQKGVIHRDLKPSNVLVGMQDGQAAPKVIDFGVAKATGQRLTEATFHTRFAQMIGTPLYMSPEQAELSALDIDTRSDVYSLGVLLYELLTSTTPFTIDRLRDAPFDELRRIIREEDPPTPSARLTALNGGGALAAAARRTELPRLVRKVHGDLDWITMKALEKDRARRYESASALASDVERYLADEPVEACPPSYWYRARKFARRNRAGVTATAALGALVLVAVGTAGWTLRERGRETARTARAVQAAWEESTRLRREALEEAEHQERWRAKLSTARAALDGGLSLVQGREETLDPELADEVTRLARTLEDDWRGLLAVADLDRISFDGVTRVLSGDAWSQAYRDVLERNGLDPRTVSADDAAARIAAQEPPVRDAFLDGVAEWFGLAQSGEDPERDWLSAVLTAAAPAGLQRQIYGAVIAGDRSALEALARRPDVLEEPIPTLRSLARGLSAAEAPGAVEFLRRARDRHPGNYRFNLTLGAALNDADPLEAVACQRIAVALRPESGLSHGALGLALYRSGQVEAAVSRYRVALQLDPGSSSTHVNLGVSLRDLGRVDEAIDSFRAGIAIDPDNVLAHGNLGHALYERGDREEGTAECRIAVELDPQSADGHYSLGLALQNQGDLRGARESYVRALELDPERANVHNHLSVTLLHLGDLPGALAEARAAIELAPEYAEAYNSLGRVLAKQGDLGASDEAYRRSLELAPESPNAAYNLGNNHFSRGDLDGAIELYGRAIELDPTFAQAHCNRANARQNLGDISAAISGHRTALHHDPGLANSHYGLGFCLLRQGDHAGAIFHLGRTVELVPDWVDAHNNLAWLLVSCETLEHRDPQRACALAQRAVELVPGSGPYWTTLGAARYRAGDLPGAAAALERATELRGASEHYAALLRAMTHSRLGEEEDAQDWFSRATDLAEAQEGEDPEWIRLRTEAEEVLEIGGRARDQRSRGADR